MAKTTIPGMKTGSGPLSKLIVTAVVIAMLVLVIKYPSDAASFTKSLFSGIGYVIDGIVSFLRAVGN
jgi:hypothetical protein